jgi:hypothetical protein
MRFVHTSSATAPRCWKSKRETGLCIWSIKSFFLFFGMYPFRLYIRLRLFYNCEGMRALARYKGCTGAPGYRMFETQAPGTQLVIIITGQHKSGQLKIHPVSVCHPSVVFWDLRERVAGFLPVLLNTHFPNLCGSPQRNSVEASDAKILFFLP